MTTAPDNVVMIVSIPFQSRARRRDPRGQEPSDNRAREAVEFIDRQRLRPAITGDPDP